MRYVCVFLASICFFISGCKVAEYPRSSNVFEMNGQVLGMVIREKIKEKNWIEMEKKENEIVAAYHEPWKHKYEMIFRVHSHPDGKSSFDATLFSSADIPHLWAWAVLYWPAWNGMDRTKKIGNELIASIVRGRQEAIVEPSVPKETPVFIEQKAVTKFCPTCQKSFAGEIYFCPHDGTKLIETQ